MSESLNVNVLVAAKEEYTKQFTTIVEPYYYNLLEKIYKDSQLKNERRKVSISNFQKELKNVRNWSEYKIEENFKTMNLSLPYLMDLITAIFVSHVKILASVRLKGDGKSIKIKVPNLNIFLHKILINICEYFYYEPFLYIDNDKDKDKINIIISNSINDAFSKQIPIDYILKEYLSGVFDDDEENNYENENENENEYNNEKIPLIPIEPIDNNFVNEQNLNHEVNKKESYENFKDNEILPNNIDNNETTETNINEFNDLKNKNKNNVKINKTDMDSESDESDNEDYEDYNDNDNDNDNDNNEEEVINEKIVNKKENEKTLF